MPQVQEGEAKDHALWSFVVPAFALGISLLNQHFSLVSCFLKAVTQFKGGWRLSNAGSSSTEQQCIPSQVGSTLAVSTYSQGLHSLTLTGLLPVLGLDEGKWAKKGLVFKKSFRETLIWPKSIQSICACSKDHRSLWSKSFSWLHKVCSFPCWMDLCSIVKPEFPGILMGDVRGEVNADCWQQIAI